MSTTSSSKPTAQARYSTTSSSKPTAQACYSTTSAKHSQHSTNTESSSTKKSACSASQLENCSDTWSLPGESKQTPKKSKESLGCKNQQTSKAYNSSQEDSQH